MTVPTAYAALVATNAGDLDEQQLDALVDALALHNGVPAMFGGCLCVRLTVDTRAGLSGAFLLAVDAVVHALHVAGIARGPAPAPGPDDGDDGPDDGSGAPDHDDDTVEVVGVEVLTEAEFERRLDWDGPADDLVPTARAAELLGVSRQRVLQLRDEHDDFPAPIRLGGRGLHWSRRGILRFDVRRRRGPDPAPTTALEAS